MNFYKTIFLLFISILLKGSIYSQEIKFTLQQANNTYIEALKTSSRLNRQKALNEALTLYKELEKTSKPTQSGLLYATIGDLYYHLEEPALAIFYYYRALKIEPMNFLVKSHLYLAQDRLNLPIEFQLTSEEYILSFGNRLSQSQRWEVLFALVVICLMVGFVNLYWPFRLGNAIAFMIGILTTLMLLNLILTLYLIPIEGVLIEPSGLYSQPEKIQSQLKFTPLLKGTKLRVIGINSQNDWLKIRDSEGTIGYIPSSSLRVL